jgi:hypothetical protein
VSRYVSADDTLVRAHASFKSLEKIEVALDPAEYNRRLRAQDRAAENGPLDPDTRGVDIGSFVWWMAAHHRPRNRGNSSESTWASGTSSSPT